MKRDRVKTSFLLSVFSVFVAASFNWVYWGFPFFRPPRLSVTGGELRSVSYRHVKIDNVDAAMNEVIKSRKSCTPEMCRISRSWPSLFQGAEDSYYCLEECLLPDNLSSENLEQLFDKENISTEALLSKLDLRLDAKCRGPLCYGVVQTATYELNGQRFLLLGARSNPFADNDRYQYAEASFRELGSSWELINSVKFMYEASGFEGCEFLFFLATTLPTLFSAYALLRRRGQGK